MTAQRHVLGKPESLQLALFQPRVEEPVLTVLIWCLVSPETALQRLQQLEHEQPEEIMRYIRAKLRSKDGSTRLSDFGTEMWSEMWVPEAIVHLTHSQVRSFGSDAMRGALRHKSAFNRDSEYWNLECADPAIATLVAHVLTHGVDNDTDTLANSLQEDAAKELKILADTEVQWPALEAVAANLFFVDLISPDSPRYNQRVYLPPKYIDRASRYMKLASTRRFRRAFILELASPEMIAVVANGLRLGWGHALTKIVAKRLDFLDLLAVHELQEGWPALMNKLDPCLVHLRLGRVCAFDSYIGEILRHPAQDCRLVCLRPSECSLVDIMQELWVQLRGPFQLTGMVVAYNYDIPVPILRRNNGRLDRRRMASCASTDQPSIALVFSEGQQCCFTQTANGVSQLTGNSTVQFDSLLTACFWASVQEKSCVSLLLWSRSPRSAKNLRYLGQPFQTQRIDLETLDGRCSWPQNNEDLDNTCYVNLLAVLQLSDLRKLPAAAFDADLWTQKPPALESLTSGMKRLRLEEGTLDQDTFLSRPSKRGSGLLGRVREPEASMDA
jgi:hypothetical protein